MLARALWGCVLTYLHCISWGDGGAHSELPQGAHSAGPGADGLAHCSARKCRVSAQPPCSEKFKLDADAPEARTQET